MKKPTNNKLSLIQNKINQISDVHVKTGAKKTAETVQFSLTTLECVVEVLLAA